jgi:phage/plasmid-associated DNA primase
MNYHDEGILTQLKLLDPDFSVIKENMIYIANELRKQNRFDEVIQRFNLVLQKIYYAEQLLTNYKVLTQTLDESKPSNHNLLYKFTEVDFNKLKPYQKLLLKLLDLLEQKEYRKSECIMNGNGNNSMLYQEIKIPHKTHAWQPVCTILEFIHKHCSMTNDYENWLLLTSTKDMDKQIEAYLIKTTDTRLPTLRQNRNLFSFQNGLYYTISDTFIHYESPEHHSLTSNEVSAKFFDIPFRYANTSDPYEIHTPYLDSIYKYQQLSDEVMEINKMFMGRMLYELGQFDQWQVIPFLLGSGGTGKSTIHHIIRNLYDHDQVGIIGNNYQKTFGLSDIYNKKIFIAPEIKNDWGIDQAEFQEMVSGGRININIKNKSSITVQWNVPGMLGGNENPGFIDNASSIQRRIVVTRFDHKVVQGDPELGKKLENEMDAIIKKCNLVYLNYALQYKNQDIWNWLPKYFLDTQDMMAQSTNALNAFLASNQVVLEESHCIPMDEFFKHFNYFCRNNNFKRPNINVDMYKAPFSKHKVVILENKNITYHGRIFNSTRVLQGVDLMYHHS